MVTISQDLTSSEEEELLSFLGKNSDVFEWRTSDLTGVTSSKSTPSARPRKQRLHQMSDEKVAAAKAEVQRLLDAGFIREVYY
jgi:hypothetical protein